MLVRRLASPICIVNLIAKILFRQQNRTADLKAFCVSRFLKAFFSNYSLQPVVGAAPPLQDENILMEWAPGRPAGVPPSWPYGLQCDEEGTSTGFSSEGQLNPRQCVIRSALEFI